MCVNKTNTKQVIWSVYQFMARFPDEQAARAHIESLRWPNGITCPHCGNNQISKVRNERPMPYRCKGCRKHFSTKTGTVLQSSNLPLHKCLMAIYMLTTAKKGIPSTQLAKELGCTQKAAWHLAHRIRRTLEQNGSMLSGDVEIDETYIGATSTATRSCERGVELWASSL